MKKLLLIFLIALTLSACTDENGSKRVLESNGYKNVQTTGYNFFACSDSDTFATGFIAESPNGQTVSGTVCKGFLKGSTIRFE